MTSLWHRLASISEKVAVVGFGIAEQFPTSLHFTFKQMGRPCKLTHTGMIRFFVYNGPSGKEMYKLDSKGRIVSPSRASTTELKLPQRSRTAGLIGVGGPTSGNEGCGSFERSLEINTLPLSDPYNAFDLDMQIAFGYEGTCDTYDDGEYY
jgi:hypothetical protein